MHNSTEKNELIVSLIFFFYRPVFSFEEPSVLKLRSSAVKHFPASKKIPAIHIAMPR
jgi:hypothetical protein